MKNVSAEAGARMIYLATRFFIPPFILGHVGLEAYGLYGTVFMLVAYFGISALGFSNAYIKYVAQFAATGETDRANRLLSTGMTLMSGVGLTGFSLFVFAWPMIARWMKVPPALNHDGRLLALLIVGIFFTYLALSVFRDTLTGVQQIGLVQKIWTASFLLETALIFVLVASGFGLPGLGVAFVLRTAFDIACHWHFARKRLAWLQVRFVRPDKESLRLLIRYGGVVQINSMLSIFLSSIERVIAAPLLGLGACGLLDLGKRFPSMATSIPSAFASSVLPSASDLHARSGETGISHLYLLTSRYMSIVSGTLFAFLCFFAAPCLTFWMSSVPANAVVVLILFSIGSQIHMLTGPGTSIVKAAGKPHFEFHYSLTNVAALALVLPIVRFATGGWSVTSITAAVSLATALSATWFLAVANRELRVSPIRFLQAVVLPGALPYGVAAMVAWPAYRWLTMHSRWEAAAMLVVAGSAYVVLLLIANLALIATPAERGTLQGSASRWAGRWSTAQTLAETNP
jgi:O-antigen/teichoic acid export membrane protein